MEFKLIDSVAKAKRNELILNLQGTKKYPKLKIIREKLLDLKTSVELAEILDVTRPTMSKLEKCTNKLSGAQYLAICALIEKKKNEALLTLDDINLDKNTFREILINKLSLMTAFYGVSYILELLNLLQYKKENNEARYVKSISKLREFTCLENWINSINYNEDLSENEVNLILSEGDIFIDFSSFESIGDINSFLDKYAKADKKGIGHLFYIYKDLLLLLDKIQKKVESSVVNEDIVNFVVKFSLLQKTEKLEPLTYEELNGYLGFPTPKHPVVFIVQNESIAKDIKKDTVYGKRKFKGEDGFEKFRKALEVLSIDKIEICKYKDNKIKRWLFDYEIILNEISNLNDEEKNLLNNRRMAALKPNVYIEGDDSIDLIETEKDVEEFISKMDEYEMKYKRGKKIMNEKLEGLIKEILKYISPNETKI